MKEYLTSSAEETAQLGVKIGRTLPPGTVVCLFGELAAGKTTFIKGLIAGAAHLDPSEVQSPTFTYLNIYEGTQRIYHFDLYRLRDADEFLAMGFDEFFDRGGICFIEWSERIASCLPAGAIRATLTHEGQDKRKIVIV